MDKQWILNLVQSIIKALREPKEVSNFPQVQEVKVLNEKEIEFPEIQKVEITNQQPFPDFPVYPKMPEVDFSETNALLKQVIQKLDALEKKKEDVNVTLEIV